MSTRRAGAPSAGSQAAIRARRARRLAPAAVPAPRGNARILVVGNDHDPIDPLVAALRFQGFPTTAAATGADPVALIRADGPDLALLAVHLPGGNGIGVCRELRFAGLDLGVVLIGAPNCSSADKVAGLTYGDDYVTAPYIVDEVVARVRAVLRRLRDRPYHPVPGPVGAVPADHGGVWRYADVELDGRTYQVRRAGQVIDLSPTEFRLLSYLLEHPHRVLTRAEILSGAWGRDFAGEPAIVDTYVSYLRRKLHSLGPPLIHTRRGFGYVLT